METILVAAYLVFVKLFHSAVYAPQVSGIRYRSPENFGLVNTDGVICYGIARIVENKEERWEVLNTFNHCLQPDAEEIPPDVVSTCYAVEIKITTMTGRQQREGTEFTYWEYSFE